MIILLMPPPKLRHHRINIVTKSFRKLKNTHSVGGNRLEDNLNKDLLSSM